MSGTLSQRQKTDTGQSAPQHRFQSLKSVTGRARNLRLAPRCQALHTLQLSATGPHALGHCEHHIVTGSLVSQMGSPQRAVGTLAMPVTICAVCFSPGTILAWVCGPLLAVLWWHPSYCPCAAPCLHLSQCDPGPWVMLLPRPVPSTRAGPAVPHEGLQGPVSCVPQATKEVPARTEGLLQGAVPQG